MARRSSSADEQVGIYQGQCNPCLYHHLEWNLRVLLHGEDFVSARAREMTEKFCKKLEERLEMKTIVIGK